MGQILSFTCQDTIWFDHFQNVFSRHGKKWASMSLSWWKKCERWGNNFACDFKTGKKKLYFETPPVENRGGTRRLPENHQPVACHQRVSGSANLQVSRGCTNPLPSPSPPSGGPSGLDLSTSISEALPAPFCSAAITSLHPSLFLQVLQVHWGHPHTHTLTHTQASEGCWWPCSSCQGELNRSARPPRSVSACV